MNVCLASSWVMFLKVISKTVLEKHFSDSDTVVAGTLRWIWNYLLWYSALTSFCFILALGHSEGFHSFKGHRSVHYVLGASFILSWRSLFIEPKLALRMETNGKRMCIWIHVGLFMPTDDGTEHVQGVFIYLFILVDSSCPSWNEWVLHETGFGKRKTLVLKSNARDRAAVQFSAQNSFGELKRIPLEKWNACTWLH